ncbi:MAG: TetR/AcrR family transcriptional regulator [Chloroflexota bacterium]
MGRKSLAKERTNQIIDAFEQCIVKHGYEQATLQRTAEQANLNIGMIHHYIGNRDDLLRQMVARLIKKSHDEMAHFAKLVPAKKRLPYLLNTFFSIDGESDEEQILDALITASGRNPLLRELITDINQVYEKILTDELSQMYPQATPEDCQQVTFSILSLAYGSSLLVDIGGNHHRKRQALQAAEALANGLGTRETDK